MYVLHAPWLLARLQQAQQRRESGNGDIQHPRFITFACSSKGSGGTVPRWATAEDQQVHWSHNAARYRLS